jgi:hypothetical protein
MNGSFPARASPAFVELTGENHHHGQPKRLPPMSMKEITDVK